MTFRELVVVFVVPDGTCNFDIISTNRFVPTTLVVYICAAMQRTPSCVLSPVTPVVPVNCFFSNPVLLHDLRHVRSRQTIQRAVYHERTFSRSMPTNCAALTP